MKLKKLLAAVTAAALAVTTMAVTSFTASAAIANGNGATLEPDWGSNGQYMVKYGAELSSAQWKECYGISFNVSFADGIGEDGSFGGKISHTAISSFSKEYNNTDATIDGDTAVISYKSSSPLDADGTHHNTWSYFMFESWWGNDMTVDSYTFLDKDGNDLKVTFTPPPVATKWTKKSAGSYSFTSIDRPDGADYGSAEICPEEEDVPLSDLLPAGKTAADIRKITVTAGVGGWQSFDGAVGTNIFKEDGTSDWASVALKPTGSDGAAGTVTKELDTPYGVDPEYTLKLQSYYMNYGTTVNVTITIECAEGEEPGDCEHTGGTATCQEKATCTICGEKYGELGAHKYVDGTCEVCGTPESTTPVTPVDPVDPTPVDPTPVDPTPVDPTPVDPTPVDPTPVDPSHTHTPATVWSSDATNHWHACSGCTDKLDLAPHTSDSGTVTTPATATTTGTKTYKCTVCGYVMNTETIPATGTGDTPAPAPAPSVPDHNYTGGVVIPVMNNNGTGSNTPVISGDSGKSGWDAIGEEALAAPDGTKIEVNMNGSTKVPSSIFNAIKDKDVDIVFNMGRGLKWTVNGLSVTKASNIDFDFSKNTRHIPDEVVDAAEGSYKKQLSLDHNGNFGFAAVMTYDIGARYNGSYANLFYYNPKSKELELIDCSLISGGKASFVLTHASDYLITITEEPLGDFEDVSAASGISSDSTDANAAVFAAVLAVITAAFGVVVYKKRRHN